MNRIKIEVTEREIRTLMEVAFYIALRKRSITEGASSHWELTSRVLREVAETIEIQIDPEEEREIRQAQAQDKRLARGVGVKKGMAFLSPQAAVQMMNTMASGQGLFKDTPTLTSLVRKIAARMGRRAPPVVPSPKASGKPSDMTPTPAQLGSKHQNYMPDELQKYPARDWENNPGGIDLPPEQDVMAQDTASMRGSGKSSVNVQDPAQQERTDDQEDPTKWFAEAKRLLNSSPWGLMEEDHV